VCRTGPAALYERDAEIREERGIALVQTALGGLPDLIDVLQFRERLNDVRYQRTIMHAPSL